MFHQRGQFRVFSLSAVTVMSARELTALDPSAFIQGTRSGRCESIMPF